MFKALKDKLKKTISSFTKKVEEEGVSTEVEKGFFDKVKDKFSKTDKSPEEVSKVVNESPVKVAEKEDVVPEKISETIIEEPKELKLEEPFVSDEVEEVKVEETKVEEEKKEEYKDEEDITPVKEEVKVEEEITPEQIKEGEPNVEFKKEPISEIYDVPEEKKGFFSKIKEKIVTKKISEKQFDEMFWELETGLLENNVALEVIDKIKKDLQIELVNKPILRSRIENIILRSLKKSIEGLFVERFDLLEAVKVKKPYVICFVGINGSGKTTSIAKVARLFLDKGNSVVLAAGDTFRAAAISQLEEHANKLGVKIIKHDYGSDPAAVAFDAIKHATAKKTDIVLIDTAGRINSNENLTQEMKKIIRVAKPDLKIFVGESITGNDCVEQAKQFNAAIGIDGIILSKADIDEKGGAAISVSYVTKKPILYIGVGQEYKDLKEFDSSLVMEGLGF